jgi:hypothetical protein
MSGEARYYVRLRQGDRMSWQEIAQNEARPIFLPKLKQNFFCLKQAAQLYFWASSVKFLKNCPKRNNRRIG